MTFLLCTYTELEKGYTIELTLLHSERPKLYTVLAFLSTVGLKRKYYFHSWS